MPKVQLAAAALAAAVILAFPSAASAWTVASAGRAEARYCRYFDRGGSMPKGVQERSFFAEAWLRDQIAAGNRRARRRIRQIHRNHPECPLPMIPRSALR